MCRNCGSLQGVRRYANSNWCHACMGHFRPLSTTYARREFRLGTLPLQEVVGLRCADEGRTPYGQPMRVYGRPQLEVLGRQWARASSTTRRLADRLELLNAPPMVAERVAAAGNMGASKEWFERVAQTSR